MELTTENPVENAPETTRLFDAEAKQTIGLTLKQNGKKYRVAHILRAVSDDEFFKFEEKKNVTQKISGEGVLNVSTSDNSLKAAEWLWDLLALGREGYVDRPDWKEKTNLIDKATAINQGLLAVFVAEEDSDDPFSEGLADAETAELFEDEFNDDALTCIRLDCLFNETPLTSEHHFRQPSAADVNDYEKTMRKLTNRINARRGFRQKKGEQTAELAIPSKARELCALYDRLIEQSVGYVSRVPAHHKREAVLELFSREVELTEKN